MRSGGVSRVAEKLGGGSWCRVGVRWTVGNQAEVGNRQKRAEATATPNSNTQRETHPPPKPPASGVTPSSQASENNVRVRSTKVVVMVVLVMRSRDLVGVEIFNWNDTHLNNHGTTNVDAHDILSMASW